MRVLHIATRFALGGSERDILRVIEWELAQGHEVHLALGGAPDPAVRADLPPAVRVRQVPNLQRSLRPWSDLRALRELRTLVREGAYDIVHTHQSKAGILGRIAARNSAHTIVHTVHMASFGPGYGGMHSRVFARAERYCGPSTNLVVCVGTELRDRYLEAGVAPSERFAIMRTPIDIDHFAAARTLDDAARAAQRKALDIPAGLPLLLSVGALEPRKRQRLLIERLAPLLSSGRAVLAFAGEGEERRALEQQVATLRLGDSVRLLGHRSDLVPTLACTDALLLASRVEGVPRVLIEALSAGVPVVSTDVEGLREIPGAPITIVDREAAGLLSAVKKLLDGPRPEPLPLSALEDWRAERVDEQIEAIYERIGAPVAS